jgi:uncharacterized membrane protein YqhA
VQKSQIQLVEADIMLIVVLGLIDDDFKLLIMVIVGGYETFVKRRTKNKDTDNFFVTV